MSLVPYESDSDTGEEDAAAGDAAVVDRTIYGARPEGVLPGLIYLDVPASVAQCSTFLTVQRGFANWFGDRLRCVMQPNVSSLSAPAHACEAAPVFQLLPTADQVIEMPLHISLSRYFTLRQEATDGFIAALRSILETSGMAPFTVSMEGCQTFNASEPVPVPQQASTGSGGVGSTAKDSGPGLLQARVFLGMLLGAGRAEVLQLIAATDRLMRQHGLLPFYDPAEPHVSIAVGTQIMAAGASGGADGRKPAGAASQVSATVSGKRCAAALTASASVSGTPAGLESGGSRPASTALLEAGRSSDEDAGPEAVCGPPAAKRARCAEGTPATEDDVSGGAGGSGRAGERGTQAACTPGITPALPGVAAIIEPVSLCNAPTTSSAAGSVEQPAAKGASGRQRVVRTGDYAASSADVGCADEPSSIFEVADVCVKLGRHVFRLPLPRRR